MYFGRLFQLIWNSVPAKLYQSESLKSSLQELKKLTTRAYDRFGVNVFISHKMIGEFWLKDDVF